MEASNNESEHLKERLKECEKQINDLKKEANNYQNILQLSQSQFVVLEKKYNRAKKLIREFQQREVDMVSLNISFKCICSISDKLSY